MGVPRGFVESWNRPKGAKLSGSSDAPWRAHARPHLDGRIVLARPLENRSLHDSRAYIFLSGNSLPRVSSCCAAGCVRVKRAERTSVHLCVFLRAGQQRAHFQRSSLPAAFILFLALCTNYALGNIVFSAAENDGTQTRSCCRYFFLE